MHFTGQNREVQLTSFPIPWKQIFSSGRERPKRKAPQKRGLVNKWAKEDDSDSCLPSTSTEDLSEAERSNLETELFGWGEDEINKVTQTEFTKHELSTKIETIIVKNEFKAKTSQACVKIVNKLSY